jgi:hypothetical protein
MPYTAATTVETFQTPEGKQWRLAGTNEAGHRYFVPSHLDPAKVMRLAWASEELLTAELGPLAAIPAQRTAA